MSFVRLSTIVCNRVLLDKLPVVQLLKNFSLFNGIQRFIPEFTRAATVRQIQSTYPSLIPHSFKIYFNIILSFKPRSSEWSLPFMVSNQNSVNNSLFPIYIHTYIHTYRYNLPMPSSFIQPLLWHTVTQYTLWSSPLCNFFHPPIIRHRSKVSLQQPVFKDHQFLICLLM